MLELNKIYCESNVDTVKSIDDNSIDLIVTSPPYDGLREYNGYCFEFDKLAPELYRIMKPGCVMVWVVGDECVDGSETGTSFKQALHFMECGFKLHDTMIYEKNSATWPAKKGSKRYTQIFEYMFVFVKGDIRDDITLISDKKNKWAGFQSWSKGIKPVPEYSLRNNIWTYVTALDGVKGHPAIFPLKLAEDHIKSWSVEGDLVYDPFMGSGTTAYAALKLNRKFLGSEISSEYVDLANNRIKDLLSQSNADPLF